MTVVCGIVIAASLFVFEGLIFATFRWLWLLHRVLWLEGLVVFIIRYDVCRKYLCLLGLWPFNHGAESPKRASTGSRCSQAHIGGWVQRDGLCESSLGLKKVLCYCLSLLLRCPLLWGNGHRPVGSSVEVTVCVWPLLELGTLP